MSQLDGIEQRAAAEWARRPEDQRFRSIDDVYAAVEKDTRESSELPPVDRRMMRVDQTNGGVSWGGASFTNWSFGQLCQLAGAPARHLQERSPGLVKDYLNECLSECAAGSTVVPYVQRNSDSGKMQLRAITSERYERIPHLEILDGLRRLVHERGWINPPDWSGEPSGIYYGDRSMFVLLIEDASRSIVTHPQATKEETLSRLLMVWNSEEGFTSWGACVAWYQFICGNHLIWGAQKVRQFRLRHVGNIRARIETAFGGVRQLMGHKEAFQDDLDGIRFAMGDRLSEIGVAGRSDAKIIADLTPVYSRKSGGAVNAPLAARAIKRAIETGDDPRLRWGAVNAITSLARDKAHADARKDLERIAVTLMPRPKKGGRPGEVVWTV